MFGEGVSFNSQGPPDLGDFPRSGEMTNFKTGEIPQIWGKDNFFYIFFVMEESIVTSYNYSEI